MYVCLLQVPANSMISGSVEFNEVPVIKKMKAIREMARKKSKIQNYSFHCLAWYLWVLFLTKGKIQS